LIVETMETAPAEPVSRVRASDTEREDAVARLHAALGEGRLDLAETEERVAAAYAARFRDELPPLLADLPTTFASFPGGSASPAWNDVWVSIVWRARTTLLGAGDRPTPAQCRTAVWLTVLAMVWMTVWAVVGAAAVA
jgi:DUF1707 SHOCT-like domain